MTTHQAKSRLLMLAQVCTEEGQRWPRGKQRIELAHVSLQLAHLANSIDHQPGPVVEATIEAAINIVVPISAARAFAGVKHA